MAREHLLLIDANEESAQVRELALRQAGYSVARAANCDQAWHLFDESIPSLIVFDLANCKEPEGFLTKLMSTRASISQSLPCVFLCELETCSELPESLRPSLQECLVKPVYLRDLISRVNLTLESKRRALWTKHDGGRSRYSGELSDLGVVDLLQTIDVCKKSGVVSLKTPAGDGEIWFKEGALVDASFGKLQAEAAVYRMIRLDQGSFGVQFKSVRRAKAMSCSTQQVLLEGLSRLDRWHRFCEQLPSLDEPLIADPSYLKREGKESSPNADVTALLRRFKGRKSIREVLQESRRSDLDLLEIISEVYFCGALVPASTLQVNEARKASRSGKIDQERTRRPVARTQRMTSDSTRPRVLTGEGQRPRSNSSSGVRSRSIPSSEERPRSISSSGVRPRSISSSEERPRSISSSGVRPRSISSSEERPRSISSSGVRPRSISSSEERPRSISSSGERPRSISSSGERPRAMTARMTSRGGPLSPPEPERRAGRPRSSTYASMGSSRSTRRGVARTLVIPYSGDEEPTLPLDPPPSNRRRPNSATMVYLEDAEHEAQIPFAHGSQRKARTRASDYKEQEQAAANAGSASLRVAPESQRGERSRREMMLAQLEDSSRGIADQWTDEDTPVPMRPVQTERRMHTSLEATQQEAQAGIFGAIFGCVLVVGLVLAQPFLAVDHAAVAPGERHHGGSEQHGHAVIDHATLAPQDRDHGGSEQHGHAVMENEHEPSHAQKLDLGGPTHVAPTPEPLTSEAVSSCEPDAYESKPPIESE